MSKHIINAGATSQRFYIYLQDSTTGQGETGVTSATCYYLRDLVTGSMPTAVTLTFGAVFASPGTYPTWTSGQVREIGYMPGIYLIDIPDAVFAAGARNVVVQITPTTGTPWLPVNLEFTLSAVNIYNLVNMGITALPDTAVTTNGSLITSGTGTAQLSTSGGAVTAGTVNDKTGYSLAAGAITSTTFGADAITASVIANGAIDAATFAAGAIDATAIATGAIDADAIAADAITSAKIANSAISIRLATDGTASEARIETGTVAADVWNAAYASYTTAGTFGKLMDVLRKANFVIEGTTTAGSTTTSVNTNLTGYVTNAFDNQTILFISGALAGTAGLISGSTSGGGTFTLAETLPGTPASGVDFVVLGTHVHTKQGIADTTWSTDVQSYPSTTAGYWLYEAGLNSQNAASNITTVVGAAYQESVADTLLGRNVAGGSNTGRLVKEALYALRNKSEIVGSTLNVYDETDGGIAWSATVASSAGANPITGVDPA